MTRLLRLGAAAVAGIVVGAGASLAVQSGADPEAGPVPGPATPATAAAPTTVTPDPDPGDGTRPSATRAPTVLAWTAGGLPADFAQAARALPETAATTVVAGDPVLVDAVHDAGGARHPSPPPGLVLGLDAIGIDPTTYGPFAARRDRGAVEGLAAGQALVGTTSAAVHGLAPGDRVHLRGGPVVEIVGVVDDRSVAAAELVLPAAGAGAAGVTTPRYLLARPAGAAAPLVTALRALAPEQPLRVRTEGETPYLRSSDAVLPQSRIAATFGSFAFTPTPGARELRPEPAWVDANIVAADVPVLGRVRCHRSLIPALRGALQELADRNLAGLVETYDGCYNPRLVAVGGSISRHAWGAAIDLNFGGNRTGFTSIQDPRLVEVMARWGFASGDGWLVPDPGHFEYVGPPRP